MLTSHKRRARPGIANNVTIANYYFEVVHGFVYLGTSTKAKNHEIELRNSVSNERYFELSR